MIKLLASGMCVTQIPEALAREADKRAIEIFEQEMRYGRTFQECLGQIYIVAVQAAMADLLDMAAD